jgi:IS66 Orf2 like protein
MLHLSSNERHYFYNQLTDMHKGCYGLCGIVQNELKKTILPGDVFVFINRRQIKLNYCSGTKMDLPYRKTIGERQF